MPGSTGSSVTTWWSSTARFGIRPGCARSTAASSARDRTPRTALTGNRAAGFRPTGDRSTRVRSPPSPMSSRASRARPDRMPLKPHRSPVRAAASSGKGNYASLDVVAWFAAHEAYVGRCPSTCTACDARGPASTPPRRRAMARTPSSSRPTADGLDSIATTRTVPGAPSAMSWPCGAMPTPSVVSSSSHGGLPDVPTVSASRAGHRRAAAGTHATAISGKCWRWPPGAVRPWSPPISPASAVEKGKRVLFIVDRIELVGQAVATFSALGLQVGVLQGENTNLQPGGRHHRGQSSRPSAPGRAPDWVHVVIIDECHILHQSPHQADGAHGTRWHSSACRQRHCARGWGITSPIWCAVHRCAG